MYSLISDLDNTLIYSKRGQGVCVEKKDDREITFMTEKALETINLLLQKDEFCFIPCTARSFTQASRIDFIHPENLPFMICDLGASIYRHGKKDLVWEKILIDGGYIFPERIRAVRKELEKLDLSRLRKVVSNSDYFLVYCFYEKKDAYLFFKEAMEYCTDDKVNFFVSGRKVYCYPKILNKSLAVVYLISHENLGFTYTAGDTMFDSFFNLLGNQCLLPEHAEFNNSSAIVCGNGIQAGEEILNQVVKLFVPQK